MKILDCTLRDGGYYNSWDFDYKVVRCYLETMAESRIDMVELGFRNYVSSDFKGAHFFTTESYLTRLDLPFGPEYGVMIDASMFSSLGQTASSAIKELFVNATDSRLTFVRVACHPSEIKLAGQIAKELKLLGYKVFVNLMQISLCKDDEIINMVEVVSKWTGLDVLYFADSLGNMKAADIERTIGLVSSCWDRDIGVHTHNNMGQALSNAIVAKNAGAEFIDVTVTGMGRGAGNAETELLLAELEASGFGDYDVFPLSKLVMKYFQPMKAALGWGVSLPYFMAAKYAVHPTYIQKILSDNHFGETEKIGAVSYIPRLSGKSSYDYRVLNDLISFPAVNEQDSDLKVNDISSIDIEGCISAVLIGSGEMATRHIYAIEHFLQNTNNKVFALNQGIKQINSLIDIHVISHNAKQINYQHLLKGLEGYVLAPAARFAPSEIERLNTDRIINYPMTVAAGTFLSDKKGCSIPFDLTAAYALSAIVALGFTKIYLIGFDGYEYADSRQKEMSELFHLFRSKYPSVDLVALTPTTYPIIQSSVYGPIL